MGVCKLLTGTVCCSASKGKTELNATLFKWGKQKTANKNGKNIKGYKRKNWKNETGQVAQKCFLLRYLDMHVKIHNKEAAPEVGRKSVPSDTTAELR